MPFQNVPAGTKLNFTNHFRKQINFDSKFTIEKLGNGIVIWSLLGIVVFTDLLQINYGKEIID